MIARLLLAAALLSTAEARLVARPHVKSTLRNQQGYEFGDALKRNQGCTLDNALTLRGGLEKKWWHKKHMDPGGSNWYMVEAVRSARDETHVWMEDATKKAEEVKTSVVVSAFLEKYDRTVKESRQAVAKELEAAFDKTVEAEEASTIPTVFFTNEVTALASHFTLFGKYGQIMQPLMGKFRKRAPVVAVDCLVYEFVTEGQAEARRLTKKEFVSLWLKVYDKDAREARDKAVELSVTKAHTMPSRPLSCMLNAY